MSFPYSPGTEARNQKWKEYEIDHPSPIDVHCFGTDKFTIVSGVKTGYVRIFNHKTGFWQNEPCHDYYNICSVCGNLMHVYYIPGITYLALCSEECYKTYKEITTGREGDDIIQ